MFGELTQHFQEQFASLGCERLDESVMRPHCFGVEIVEELQTPRGQVQVLCPAILTRLAAKKFRGLQAPDNAGRRETIEPQFRCCCTLFKSRHVDEKRHQAELQGRHAECDRLFQKHG